MEKNGKFGQLAHLQSQKMERDCETRDGVYGAARTLRKYSVIRLIPTPHNTLDPHGPICGKKTQTNQRQSSREGRYRHDTKQTCRPTHRMPDLRHAGPAPETRRDTVWHRACPSASALFHLAPGGMEETVDKLGQLNCIGVTSIKLNTAYLFRRGKLCI